MMRGHNRPPFPPKIPGTNTRSWDVPTAIIYRPARSAMTSAPRPNYWILEFEPSRPPQIEPLMGYTSSDDPYRSIRLKFPDRESAVEFAERQDWRYLVREDTTHRRAPDRWRGEERHRLYKGADAPEAFRIGFGAWIVNRGRIGAGQPNNRSLPRCLSSTMPPAAIVSAR